MKSLSWKFGFCLKENNNNNKSALGLLVRHGDKSFTNQTLNLELYIGPIS